MNQQTTKTLLKILLTILFAAALLVLGGLIPVGS